MVKIVRVDYRIIHGQVVAKWIKLNPVDKIIIFDDLLLTDDFMADIYKMAVPNIEVKIVSPNKINETDLTTSENIMIIFRDIKNAFKVINSTEVIKELNIGATQKNKDMKQIAQGVFIDDEDFMMLKKLNDNGIKVFTQPIPEVEANKFKDIEKKF